MFRIEPLHALTIQVGPEDGPGFVSHPHGTRFGMRTPSRPRGANLPSSGQFERQQRGGLDLKLSLQQDQGENAREDVRITERGHHGLAIRTKSTRRVQRIATKPVKGPAECLRIQGTVDSETPHLRRRAGEGTLK